MCDVKQKEQIYSEFDNGLSPEEVAFKLHLSKDKRVVYGCWSYYQSQKVVGEQKSFLDVEKEYTDSLVDRLNQCIKNIAIYGRELINITKEVIEMDTRKKVGDYSFVRQVILHDIENNKNQEDVIPKLRSLSVTRRNFRHLDVTCDKVNKSKKELNDVVCAAENILPCLEINADNGTEIFVKNHMKMTNEYRLNLLDAIKE